MWRWAASGVIAMALALAGCATDATPLARDDYTRKANALCTPAISRSDDLIAHAFTKLYGDEPPSNPSAKELQALYAGILPAANESADVIKAMLHDARPLAAPEQIAQEASDLWQAIEERLDKSLRRIEEAAVQPSKAIELDADDTLPFSPENARAASLGLTACKFR